VAAAERLLALEELFWRAAGDRELYASHTAPDALHVFPGWGITELERVLEAVAEVEPWERFALEEPRVLELGPDAAAVVYTARAKRAGQDEYVAAMTTVYRRDGDDWKLVVHQQTPL
jgi:ketosteroid isomerase-like protein